MNSRPRLAVDPIPLRLLPGVDLRAGLATELMACGQHAGFVASAVGSLTRARLRFAGAAQPSDVHGALEILTLTGTVGIDGCHLHMSVADSSGRVIGGHVAPGCIVRTTAEVLLLVLPEWSFHRKLDPATGYAELAISARGIDGAGG